MSRYPVKDGYVTGVSRRRCPSSATCFAITSRELPCDVGRQASTSLCNDSDRPQSTIQPCIATAGDVFVIFDTSSQYLWPITQNKKRSFSQYILLKQIASKIPTESEFYRQIFAGADTLTKKQFFNALDNRSHVWFPCSGREGNQWALSMFYKHECVCRSCVVMVS